MVWLVAFLCVRYTCFLTLFTTWVSFRRLSSECPRPDCTASAALVLGICPMGQRGAKEERGTFSWSSSEKQHKFILIMVVF